MGKKIIVVSGINLYAGGTLSIFKDCLLYLLGNEAIMNEYRIIAFVHRVDLFDLPDFGSIEFVEYPKSRRSYFYRLWYEYYYFKKATKNLTIDVWLSLHDISPNVIAKKRAVYCHNPTPFRKPTFLDLYDEPSIFFFSLFYLELFRINIKKNDFVIVQQNWLREKFVEKLGVLRSKVIVANPTIDFSRLKVNTNDAAKNNKLFTFFYPTFPRPFKNIEIIGEALKILEAKHEDVSWEVIITVNGTENNYAKRMKSRYGKLKSLKLIGSISRNEVFDAYRNASVLLFPSVLESWGLPITEFKEFQKPILVSELPYAKETVGDYEKAVFFNPYDAEDLAHKMEGLMHNRIALTGQKALPIAEPYAKNWDELFKILLK